MRMKALHCLQRLTDDKMYSERFQGRLGSHRQANTGFIAHHSSDEK